MTLIEILADLLEASENGPDRPQTGQVLVPEQCMEVFYEGKYYHVSVEEIKDAD